MRIVLGKKSAVIERNTFFAKQLPADREGGKKVCDEGIESMKASSSFTPPQAGEDALAGACWLAGWKMMDKRPSSVLQISEAKAVGCDRLVKVVLVGRRLM